MTFLPWVGWRGQPTLIYFWFSHPEFYGPKLLRTWHYVRGGCAEGVKCRDPPQSALLWQLNAIWTVCSLMELRKFLKVWAYKVSCSFAWTIPAVCPFYCMLIASFPPAFEIDFLSFLFSIQRLNAECSIFHLRLANRITALDVLQISYYGPKFGKLLVL